MDKPRVKPLVWETITPGFYETAENFGMVYGVTRARDGRGWVADASPRWESSRDAETFDVRDLAYDWCEDHNEARILAALEPAPVSVQDMALLEIAEAMQELLARPMGVVPACADKFYDSNIGVFTGELLARALAEKGEA